MVVHNPAQSILFGSASRLAPGAVGRQAPWDEGAAERVPAPKGEQMWAVQLSDTARALRQLPNEQREALILVGAGGFSYEDAAAICNCAIGTVKSRVARARKALTASLEGSTPPPPEPRPGGREAGDEIMAELDRLVPTGEPAAGNRGKRTGS
jgi:RNA polymerase sigma-70 factor (ECF subfamily)